MINITVKDMDNGGKCLFVKHQLVGLVSQNPNDPAVMDPGKWQGTFTTSDLGLMPIGVFDTEDAALAKVIDCIQQNKTWAEWQA